MPARLLLIGLDGADGRTLDRASLDGTLPNLTRLRTQGRAWALSSERGASDDALWASFQYGADVGEHGRYFYLVPGSAGRSVFVSNQEDDRETFWDRLSSQGARIAVLDVPKSRAPRALNGFHLTDWLVHGRYSASPKSYPEALADSVIARFGAAPPSRCAYRQQSVLTDDEVRTARDNLLISVAQKLKAGQHFLAEESWDLFVIGFKEAHCGCHMMWDLFDSTHARYDHARVRRVGNPILDVLNAQDAAVGDLIAAAGPDATIIVFSTSDFLPNGSIQHLTPQIVQHINNAIAKRAGERLRRRLRVVFKRAAEPPDCVMIPHSDNLAALQVPRRLGEGGRHYRRRLDQIAATVRELVDIDDGLPVVVDVTRPAFEQTGSRAASLPHLLLHVRSNVCPRAVTSARLGHIEATPPENIRTGNHEAGGFAFATGPGADAAMAQIKSLKDFAALAQNVLFTSRPAMLAG